MGKRIGIKKYLVFAVSLPLQNMVGVAQLVEHPVVVRDVAGSSPVAHPTNLAKS